MSRGWFQRVRILAAIAIPAFAALALLSTAAAKRPASAKADYVRDVKPLLAKYCYDCHGTKKKGDLDLKVYTDAAAAAGNREVFEKVLKNLDSHEMPPENKPQPTPEERALITAWIEDTIFKTDCDNPDPGRVTLRRLNRVEYNNTIRDLVGVDFKPAEGFPSDDSGYGFDNIGDVLSLPPVLLEKYLAAAEKILDAAIVSDTRPRPFSRRFEAGSLDGTAPGEAIGGGAFRMAREGNLRATVEFPNDGEHVLRAEAYGEQAGPEPTRMSFSLDGKEVTRFDVKAVEAKPEVYEFRLPITAGRHHIAVAYLNNFVDPKNPDRTQRDRNLVVNWIEVVDPRDPRPPKLPASHQQIFFKPPPAPPQTPATAREVIQRFASRAFRRPVTDAELNRLLKLHDMARRDGESPEASVKVALTAVLVSPHFLFRGETQPDPTNPAAIHPVDEFALASRLSYFLWSTMPDDELISLAAKKRLRKNLDRQVKRMLQDPRAQELVRNFAGQWLQLRDLAILAPDRKTYPQYDDALRDAMRRETELYFAAILAEDRSVLEFLDSDYTFANERLARFYGLPGVTGDEFRRVSLRGTPRGGLLTQGSVLTVTSNPTRTSPVKRGKWVLENLLGTPPPPPPPNVPDLAEGAELKGTLRQRMEQHRDNPSCASCHARMDPIGFGLENFDGVGGWREKDGADTIDPSGKLVSGESFQGASGLKQILLGPKRNDFIRCLTEKMMTYALGRGLEYYDRCTVDHITDRMAKEQYRFSALVMEIVKSPAFQMRRGDGGTITQAAR